MRALLGLDPGLQADKLDLQLRKFLLEFLAAYLAGRGSRFGGLVLLLLVFSHLETLPNRYPTQQSGNRPVILQVELSRLDQRFRNAVGSHPFLRARYVRITHVISENPT